MRVLFRSVLALVALAAALLAAVVVGMSIALDGDRVEGWLSREAASRFGADLVFEGETRVTVFPHTVVRLPGMRLLRGETELMRTGPAQARLSPWAVLLGQARVRRLAVESVTVREWPQPVGDGAVQARRPGLLPGIFRFSVRLGSLEARAIDCELPVLGRVTEATLTMEEMDSDSARSVRFSGRAETRLDRGTFSLEAAGLEKTAESFGLERPAFRWDGETLRIEARADGADRRGTSFSVRNPAAALVRVAAPRDFWELGAADIRRDAEGTVSAKNARLAFRGLRDWDAALECKGDVDVAASGAGRLDSLSGVGSVRLGKEKVSLPMGGPVSWTAAGVVSADLVGSVDSVPVRLRGTFAPDSGVDASVSAEALPLAKWLPRARTAMRSADLRPVTLVGAAPRQAAPWQVSVAIGDVQWRKVHAREVFGRVRGIDGGLAVEEIAAKLAGGSVSGRMAIGAKWESEWDVSGVELSEVVAGVAGKSILAGPASGQFALSGRGIDATAISGGGKITLGAGRWNGFSVGALAKDGTRSRPKVAQGQSAFHSLSATLSVGEGLVEAKPLAVDFGDAAMEGAARLALGSGRFEASATVRAEGAQDCPVVFRGTLAEAKPALGTGSEADAGPAARAKEDTGILDTLKGWLGNLF